MENFVTNVNGYLVFMLPWHYIENCLDQSRLQMPGLHSNTELSTLLYLRLDGATNLDTEKMFDYNFTMESNIFYLLRQLILN